MIDYNLYGMNFINLSAVKFRLGSAMENPAGSLLNLQREEPSGKGMISVVFASVGVRSSEATNRSFQLSPLSPPSSFCTAHWNTSTLPKLAKRNVHQNNMFILVYNCIIL